MRNQKWKWVGLALLLTLGGTGPAWGQTAHSAVDNPETLLQVLDPVFEGLSGKYGWLTTVLLAVGSLRILIKPLMLALEHALQSDPEKLARLQRFEAGPVYKFLAVVLDLGASIKLPLVKPPAK